MTDRSEHTIEELTTDLDALDVAMTEKRKEKEALIEELRGLQRIRDEITEPLERKRAIERMTSGRPVTEIGL